MTFYQEIDEPREITNQEIKRYFCIFVNYQQDNWLQKWIIVEFTANNNKLVSIKLSPFFITKGLYLYLSFDLVKLSNASTCKWIIKLKALDILGNLQTT